MRRRSQFLLIAIAALSLTALGIFLALANNIEEPPRQGELIAVASVAACNLLWLVPWTIVHMIRSNRGSAIAGVVLFGICWLHFPYRYFHHPRFDPSIWKTSLDNSFYIDERFPAHAAGYMVSDIIGSGVCLGKDRKGIEALLGTAYFGWTGPPEPCIAYYYSHGVLFDGCDKLLVRFMNDVCVSVEFGGCD